jgi:hypothetical protein
MLLDDARQLTGRERTSAREKHFGCALGFFAGAGRRR